MKKKRISVVMATYNGEQYIREQLDSILNQTYPCYEMIIQDDGSTDATLEIIHQYAARDNRIKLFVNKRNLGFNENFRTACLKATGDYIAIADQDDIWYPQKLECQIHAIGDSLLCYSGFHQGNTPDISKCTFRYPNPFKKEWIVFFKATLGHTLLLQKDFAQDPENWGTQLVYDVWLTANAHLKGQVTYVSEALNWHRVHKQSATQMQSSSYKRKSINFFSKLFEGYSRRQRFQQNEIWQLFYRNIATQAVSGSIEQRLAALQLRSGILPLLKMCFLCLKYRDSIYPSEMQQPPLPLLWRSFCYPLIFAYFINDIQPDKK